jgi:hypothetical protein
MGTHCTPDTRDSYDEQFQEFLSKIIDVAKFQPREKYLYQIMQSVPFQDLEVALDIAKEQREQGPANNA